MPISRDEFADAYPTLFHISLAHDVEQVRARRNHFAFEDRVSIPPRLAHIRSWLAKHPVPSRALPSTMITYLYFSVTLFAHGTRTYSNNVRAWRALKRDATALCGILSTAVFSPAPNFPCWRISK